MDNQQKLMNVIISMCNDILLAEKNTSCEHELPELSAKEWDALLSISSIHGVLPIVMQFFEGKKVEDKALKRVVLKWYAATQATRQRYQVRIQVMQELAEMFAKEHLEVMFFKGATLSKLYPQPEWRVFSDIDFYLYGHLKEGMDVMERNGLKNRPFYHHNTEATSHGVLLENHYDFMDRLNHRTNIVIDDELKKLVAEEGKSVRATFLQGQLNNVYEMTPTMNAIFLMRHMAAHFASETVSLRMLYDWILFIKYDVNLVDWQRVLRLYKETHMLEFVAIIQELLRVHFSTESPSVLQLKTNHDKVERVWSSIVCPPASNIHKKYTISYYVQETKTYIDNRWKHQIVFPDESYIFLSFRYAWSVIKKKLGLLTIPEGR